MNGGDNVTINLYNFTATPNRVNKQKYLTHVADIEGVLLKNDTSFLHPTLILKKNKEITKANYCYIKTTNRYYFMDKDSIEALPGNRISISLTIDVLYTYTASIYNSTAFIELSSNQPTAENKFTHTYIPERTDKETLGKTFPNTPFTDGVTPNILLILSP